MKRNRGQTSILTILLAGVGFAGGILTWCSFKFDAVAKDSVDVKTDIAILATESKQYREDIEHINIKLDAIAEKLNVKYIERTLATSTSAK